MRFDLITIFPEFFSVLQLSLLGKAQRKQIVDFAVTDLRDFATDPHRSVDDTPYGGGAGMVMRPDIWGRAIDKALSANPGANPNAASGNERISPSGMGVEPQVVLAIPTPGGQLLTQKKVHQLLGATQIIVACGRYEGIDARVGQYYAQVPGVEVFEFSLGDYVLNGGEVAALALVEAVSRLVDGTVGNPDSLSEESHEGAGLLEYPVYTRPSTWRGLDVPSVLQEGNHALISQWRRQKSISRTAQVRPDLLERLNPEALDKTDREQIARCGWLCANPQIPNSEGMPIQFRVAQPDDRDNLIALARETWPMACPDYVSREQIEKFLDSEFSPQIMSERLSQSSRHRFVVAGSADRLLGYVYCVLAMNQDASCEAGIPAGDVYLSKCYVLAQLHSSGLSGALVEEAVADLVSLAKQGHPQLKGREFGLSLGTSVYNRRAQKFYKKHGFRKIGTRKFMVWDTANADVVMRRVIQIPRSS